MINLFFFQNLMRALYMFQAPTQLYAFIVHIVPYVFEDPWTIYYMRLLCCFICINACANWLAVILYDPGFRKSKDNPYINISHHADNPPDQFRPLIQESLQNHQTDHVIYDMTSKEALPWEYCELCEMHIPPRAHHCKFCKKCILKRDHHCFMVGNCIGFKNQRYFIVLAFYVAIAGGIGCYFTYKYLTEVWWPEATSWTDWIPPFAFYKWLFWGGVKGHVCLMLVHLYLEFLFGFVGCFYFVSQFAITVDGKTLFEVVKKVPIRNTNSIKRNLKSVFGELWFLNFLFPMTLVLKQRDDGIHWEGLKYDHNANKKWVDDGEIL